VNCPATTGEIVGGVRVKVPAPTDIVGIVKADTVTGTGAELRLACADTVTVTVAVAVSKRVKSAGVKRAVTLEVPAATAVALSPLVIERMLGALEVKVKVPGTADPTVGATILKIGSPTVLFGIAKLVSVGTVFPDPATTSTAADARDGELKPTELCALSLNVIESPAVNPVTEQAVRFAAI
jgi:hypothetical protein